MRCTPGNLELVAANRGSSFYAYATDHPPEAIGEEGYFLPVADRLAKGDFIRASCRNGDTLAIADLVVTKATRTAVEVASLDGLRSIQAGGLTFKTTAPDEKPARAPKP